MSYCFMRSLKMVLDYKNDKYPLPFLECVSTSPFRFVYVFTDKGGFAVNGYDPHVCVQRALDALRYKHEFKCFQSAEEALASLRVALEKGPAIIGPIDMGYRIYDPLHKFKVGADHYVVALETKEDHVIVNDPDGYPLARFPTNCFLKAWRAERISYRAGPYSMWIVKRKMRQAHRSELYRKALQLGLQNLKEKRTWRFGKATGYAGADAIMRLAEDVKRYGSSRWLSLYANFSFRVSGQRCFDSGLFIQEAPFHNEHLTEASHIRLEQAKLYGEAQLYAATKKFGQLSQALKEIGKLENELEAQLEQGLRGSCDQPTHQRPSRGI